MCSALCQWQRFAGFVQTLMFDDPDPIDSALGQSSWVHLGPKKWMTNRPTDQPNPNEAMRFTWRRMTSYDVVFVFGIFWNRVRHVELRPRAQCCWHPKFFALHYVTDCWVRGQSFGMKQPVVQWWMQIMYWTWYRCWVDMAQAPQNEVFYHVLYHVLSIFSQELWHGNPLEVWWAWAG